MRLEPTDPDARQTKLFLLLQTEQYDAALELINSGTDEIRYAFERAYSLYRSQRESEAAEQLEALGEGGHRGVVHLEAQLVRSRYPYIYPELEPELETMC